MKIKINANDFCPDDCPYFALKEIPYYEFNKLIDNYRTCENEKICEFAVKSYIKNQKSCMVKEDDKCIP